MDTRWTLVKHTRFEITKIGPPYLFLVISKRVCFPSVYRVSTVCLPCVYRVSAECLPHARGGIALQDIRVRSLVEECEHLCQYYLSGPRSPKEVPPCITSVRLPLVFCQAPYDGANCEPHACGSRADGLPSLSRIAWTGLLGRPQCFSK